jgi:SOS-response transcriptional repressor LexA
MSSLAERVDRAIRASGKTADEIARALNIAPDTISRIRTGKEMNPTLQVLVGIARETKTTGAALLGESIDLSPDDEQQLLRFRDWIDEKLATVDARQEPNAVILSTQAPARVRERVADLRPRQRIEPPFGEDASLVLRAIGDSMTGAGIFADETLYAIPAAPNAASSAMGKIIACRLGEDVFVKHLVTEHRRLFLRSANPRYLPIAIDAKADAFEILGVVVGRVGKIG